MGIVRSGETGSKRFRNVSRNFHSYIKRAKLMLPVKMSSVVLRVMERRRKRREIKKAFPMIALKSWAECLLRHKPQILLGGHAITDVSKYEAMFRAFWTQYKTLDSYHPIYNHFPPDQWGRCIPFAVHGDEGRGKAKTPVLITSFQVVISEKGLDFTNISGKLGCTHLAFILSTQEFL